MVRKKVTPKCRQECSAHINYDQGESSNVTIRYDEAQSIESDSESNEDQSNLLNVVGEECTILSSKSNEAEKSSKRGGSPRISLNKLLRVVNFRKRSFGRKDSNLDPQLEAYVKKCDFYITVNVEAEVKESLQHKLGEYIGTLSNSTMLLELQSAPVTVLYLYVSRETRKSSFLCWERMDKEDKLQVFYCPLTYSVPYLTLKGMETKNFRTVLKEQSVDSGSFTFEVYLNTSAFCDLHYSCEPVRTPAKRGVQDVMETFFGISLVNCPYSKISLKHDIEGLYNYLSNIQRSIAKNGSENVCHPALIPILRPYQENAVRWMLRQERGVHKQKGAHPLFQKVHTKDRKIVYYNRYGGFYTLQKPTTGYQPQGGILADEMGLGKTIEVLACLLNNPCSSSDFIEETTMKNEVEPESNEISEKECSDDSDSSDDSYMPKRYSRKKRAKRRLSANKKRKYISSFNKLGFKQDLKCLCGKVDDYFDDEQQVQCANCKSWQHIDCIEKKYHKGYDASQKHYCPPCWVSKAEKLYPSQATLIVTPSCISYQWEEEIEKHITPGSLKVLVYTGVQTCFVPPSHLMDYDVVLTTYNVLRKEINYVDLLHSNDDSSKKFRYKRRFMAIPSPLLCIEWWRICLDEAQMVESTTTKTAEMAQRLTAVNRWCITGTPIQKTIDDLFGLLLFLGVEPYCVKLWWKEIVFSPYCNGNFQPLFEVLTAYFWRTVKKDVLDQIGIPKQEVVTHWLSFSPVEEHFYYRKHHECSQEITKKISKFYDLDIKLSSLDRHAMTQLLNPLRCLRQACCHPQAVRGEFPSIHKSTMSMEELLTSLIKKVKNECEESHRQLIAAINGLAAIHIINSEVREAADEYREVLRLVEEHSSQIKTDKLQQLHTLHNLAELLDGQKSGVFSEAYSSVGNKVACKEKNEERRKDQCDSITSNSLSSDSTPNFPKDIGRTLRDDGLKDEASKLRSEYLAKCLSQVKAAEDQLTIAVSNLKELRSQFICKKSEPWWILAIKHNIQIKKESILVQKVKEGLIDKKMPGMLSAVHKFHDVNGLQYIVAHMLDELEDSHNVLSAAVKKLSATPSASDVNAAVDCHLRPLGRNKLKCVYCQVHELFNHYEGKLFYFSEDVAVVEPMESGVALLEPLRRGTWADSELEAILKLLLAFTKSQKADASIIEDGNLHVKLFECLKKEFRALRGVWMQIRDYASAIDELDMAAIRFRVRYPDEPQPEVPVPYILEKEEVEYTRLKLASEMVVSRNELRKKLGQLIYLQNLAKADYGRKGGFNPEQCPICHHVLGVQWNVLQCGHCFCISCIHTMLTNYSFAGRHRCPVCRQPTSNAEISFVNATELSQIPIKGSQSTKVEEVVRCLLQIKSHNPKAKVLVFSMWQDVLYVLARALSENEIIYIDLHSSPGLVENVARFRMDPSVTALLLPIRSGANGLNLIEATHVILVEPLLNLASEQQAIGRVHRIGQTKETTVHRFVVRKTIEEKMYYMLQTDQDSDSPSMKRDNDITLRELQELFVSQ